MVKFFLRPDGACKNESRESYHAPFGGSFVISMLRLAMINVCVKTVVPIFNCYGNTKDNAKYTKLGDLSG